MPLQALAPIVLLFLLAMPARGQLAGTCQVLNFGAKGEGITMDTDAVTRAVAACAKAGGGTVYFPPGRYVIGTVQLQSHIRVFLESGAVLVGSHDIANYLLSSPFGFARHYGVDVTGEGSILGMLIAKNAEDVSIEGAGEINGQGDSFMKMDTAHGGNDYALESVNNPEKFLTAMNRVDYGPVEPDHRPGTMILFFHFTNVQVHGITLRSAPNWTLHLQDVDGASISNIRILNNPKIPNNDGIDCMQCRHVKISDATIDTGDDGLAIVRSEHVNVSNSSISSRSAAIRLESTKLSTFTGLSMDTNRGIAIFANAYQGQDDRSSEDIIFSDIVIRTHLIPGDWWGKAEPIYVAVQRCTEGDSCPVRVRNVVFNNISAVAENGVLLWGADGWPITGLDFRGLRLHMIVPDPSFSESVGGNLDLRWTAESPRDGIIKSKMPAFYARNVKALRLHDVQVDWARSMPDYFSDAVRAIDFNDLEIDGFSGRQAQPSTGSAISLERGSGVSVTNSRAVTGTRTFLSLKDVKDRRIFANCDLSAAAETVSPRDARFAVQTKLHSPQAESPSQ